MSILYGIISAGNEKILVEQNLAAEGNHPQLIQKILREKNPTNAKVLYQISSYVAHVINEDDVTFLVLSDASFSRKKAFACLLDMKKEFNDKITPLQIRQAISFGFQRQFSDFLKEKMIYYSENQDNLDKLIDKVDVTKNIMIENVEKIFERGEKIEILVKKSQDMKGESSHLKSRAQKLKFKKRCENMRTKIILGIVLMIIVYFIMVFACGGFSLPCLTH